MQNLASGTMSSTSTPPSPPLLPLTSLLHTVGVMKSVHSSLGGADKALSLLGYTCKLLTNIIDARMTPTSTTTSLAEGLQNLFSQTSWARYSLRLVNGPFSTLDACINDSWSHKPLPCNGLSEDECCEEYPYTRESHPIVRVLEKTMPFAMAIYYPAEYIAFAAWKMPGLLYNQNSAPLSGHDSNNTIFPFSREKSNWKDPAFYSAVSCAAWLYYIICDIIVQIERCHRISAILEKLRKSLTAAAPPLIRTLETQLRCSQIVLIREVLCLLPAFAWSWPDFDNNPKVPHTIVNFLMWLENAVGYGTEIGDHGWIVPASGK